MFEMGFHKARKWRFMFEMGFPQAGRGFPPARECRITKKSVAVFVNFKNIVIGYSLSLSLSLQKSCQTCLFLASNGLQTDMIFEKTVSK